MRPWEEKNRMHSSSAVVLFSRLCKILPSAVLRDFFLGLFPMGLALPLSFASPLKSCPWMKAPFLCIQHKAPEAHSPAQTCLQKIGCQGRDQFQTRELGRDEYSFGGKRLRSLYLIANKVILKDFDFQMMSSSLALSWTQK
jgi:hypothetical protein